LELAKMRNLQIWYGGIRNVWADARLLYHDTDSAICMIHHKEGGDDALEMLKEIPCVDGHGSKEPGLLKIEEDRVLEVVCLGKKSYSCLLPHLRGGVRKTASAGLTVTPSHVSYKEKALDFGSGVTDTSRWWLDANRSISLGHYKTQ
jgi:hypothetical protein